MNIFEIGMLVCFGAAWPTSILKTLKSKTVAGKSIVFVIIVEIGYISGICYKLTGDRDNVIFLYCLNALMVLLDIILYMKYRSTALQKNAQL